MVPDTTHKLRETVLTFLREYIRLNGYGPTAKEVAEHFGISQYSVRKQLEILHREGRITLGPSAVTQIDVVFDGPACLRCGKGRQ